jgi:large conductance mechanosensitive channel
LNGFFKFVVRGNVVGLAVGVVIGAAFSGVVSSFVAAFMTPLISVMTSSAGQFSNKVFTVGKYPHQTQFPYGVFVNAVISFILVAAVIYFLVVLPINKLTAELNPYHDLSKAKRSCPECLSQIPAQAKRCSFCATAVDPITDEDSDKLIEKTPGEITLDSGNPPEVKFSMPSPASEPKPEAPAEG